MKMNCTIRVDNSRLRKKPIEHMYSQKLLIKFSAGIKRLSLFDETQWKRTKKYKTYKKVYFGFLLSFSLITRPF